MATIFISLLLTLVPLPVWAADGAGGGGMMTAILKVIAALAVVLGLVLLLYALGRKGTGWLPSAKGAAIRVVEMRHLAPKKTLCLVEVRGEEMLLGIGHERIEVLARFGKQSARTSGEPGFAATLNAAEGDGR